MKIIESYAPKYTATFEHPDCSPKTVDFFVDEDIRFNATDEEETAYYAQLKRNVWEQFNESGFYHTLTLVAVYVIGNEVYRKTICESECI